MLNGIQGKNPWVSFVISTVPIPLKAFFIRDEQENLILEDVNTEQNFFLEGVELGLNSKYSVNNYFRTLKEEYSIVLFVGSEYSDIAVSLEEGLKAYFLALKTTLRFNKWVNFISYVGYNTLIEYGQIVGYSKNSLGDGTDAITYTLQIKSYTPPLNQGFGKIDKGVATIG